MSLSQVETLDWVWSILRYNKKKGDDFGRFMLYASSGGDALVRIVAIRALVGKKGMFCSVFDCRSCYFDW